MQSRPGLRSIVIFVERPAEQQRRCSFHVSQHPPVVSRCTDYRYHPPQRLRLSQLRLSAPVCVARRLSDRCSRRERGLRERSSGDAYGQEGIRQTPALSRAVLRARPHAGQCFPQWRVSSQFLPASAADDGKLVSGWMVSLRNLVRAWKPNRICRVTRSSFW